jgi:hypothetical protein
MLCEPRPMQKVARPRNGASKSRFQIMSLEERIAPAAVTSKPPTVTVTGNPPHAVIHKSGPVLV